MRLVASRNVRAWCLRHVLSDPVVSADVDWFLGETPADRVMLRVIVDFGAWFEGKDGAKIQAEWKATQIKMVELVKAEEYTLVRAIDWWTAAAEVACFDLYTMLTSGVYPSPQPGWRHTITPGVPTTIHMERLSRYGESTCVVVHPGVKRGTIVSVMARTMRQMVAEEQARAEEESEWLDTFTPATCSPPHCRVLHTGEQAGEQTRP